jgi:hypothetical protein
MSYDLLTSVVVYAGFVDANCLIYLWPEEFDSCRICVISGSFSKPIFSCFLSEVRHVLCVWCGVVWCDVTLCVVPFYDVLWFSLQCFIKVLLLYFTCHLPSFLCLILLYLPAFPFIRELQFSHHNLKYPRISFSFSSTYLPIFNCLLQWHIAFKI